ncbi:hypothetical protein MMC28_002268 [Mycoblastus sanguinarius]|nr:hypothetical protein [Mycoblastus sanguinarius]
MASTVSKKRKFQGIATVKLLVGSEGAEFNVHEEQLFEESRVFRAAFESKFKEGSERTMYLPDDNANLVDYLINFLYVRSFNLLPYSPTDQEEGSIMLAVRLFVFADKYDATKVKNAILRFLFTSPPRIKNYRTPPPRCAVDHAYGHTPRNSSIRRLLVDWVVWITDAAWFEKEEHQAWLLGNPELALDLTLAFAKAGKLEWKNPLNPFQHNNAELYAEAEEVKAQ